MPAASLTMERNSYGGGTFLNGRPWLIRGFGKCLRDTYLRMIQPFRCLFVIDRERDLGALGRVGVGTGDARDDVQGLRARLGGRPRNSLVGWIPVIDALFFAYYSLLCHIIVAPEAQNLVCRGN